jgi:hypothetical protein
MKNFFPTAAMTTCCLAGLLVISSTSQPEVARAGDDDGKSQTTRADFQKWCAIVEGRWIGDVKFVTDWPGFGKKGDKITGYYEARRSEDGNVMVTRFLGGVGSESGVVFYDPAAKKIQGVVVSSGGTIFRYTMTPVGDNWRRDVKITLPDGTKGKARDDFIFTNGSKNLTIHHNGKIGEEVIKDQKDTWRRVGSPRLK